MLYEAVRGPSFEKMYIHGRVSLILTFMYRQLGSLSLFLFTFTLENEFN